MKTYAETQGNAPFDWNAFLAKESYTESELWTAANLSMKIAFNTGGENESWLWNHVFLMFQNREDKFQLYWHQMIATKALHAIESQSQEIINDLKNKK